MYYGIKANALAAFLSVCLSKLIHKFSLAKVWTSSALADTTRADEKVIIYKKNKKNSLSNHSFFYC